MPADLTAPTAPSPFGAFLMAACVLSGISGLIPHEARSATDTLAPHYSTAWYLGLVVGGVLCLVATTVLRFPAAVLAERVGVLLLAGLTTAYGVGLFLLPGGDDIVGTIVTLAFGAACAGRAWQITRHLAKLRKIADRTRGA